MVGFNDVSVVIKKKGENSGILEITPLPRGYGHTLANSLRRILLSSLEGAGVTSVKIEGKVHEYTTVEGVKEDIVEMLLNLKAVRFKSSSSTPVICKIEAKGDKVITAGDIKVGAGVEVMTPEIVIATLTDKKSSLNMEIVVEKGVGYKEADEALRSEVGRIPVDTDFSPIRNVSFDIVRARKGQVTNLDGVLLEISTDGSITPVDALLTAVKILQDFAGKVMIALGTPKDEVEAMAAAAAAPEVAPEATGLTDEVSSWKVEDLPISKRSKTGLISGGYHTVGDVAKATVSDLSSLPGFGSKSLNEIIDLMKQYGITVKE